MLRDAQRDDLSSENLENTLTSNDAMFLIQPSDVISSAPLKISVLTYFIEVLSTLCKFSLFSYSTCTLGFTALDQSVVKVCQ